MILHILDAQKKLTAHSQWLHTCLTATHEQAKRVMHIPPLDVVVKTGKFVIPEKGHLGYCPEPGLVYLTVDPENPALRKMSLSLLNARLLMNCTMRQGGQGLDMA